MKKIIMLCAVGMTLVHAEDTLSWKHDLLLKNLYTDKDFHQGDDTGSWGQGIIYRGNITKKFDNFELSILPSFQYAFRLGPSHHLSDGVFAFDPNTAEQPRDYFKKGLAIKIANEHHQLQYGELWVNYPITGVDATKLLLPTYQGLQYSFLPNKNTEFNLGYINRFNPKDDDHFKKLVVNNQTSDGLYYLNLKHQFNSKLNIQLYDGYLLDLFNQAYLGIDYSLINHRSLNNSLVLKYFNSSAIGDKKLGDIKVNYYGVLNETKYKNINLALGYQKIDGNYDFPLITGIPARYFIDWSQGMFNKKDENSYHVNFKYDLDNWIKGLDFNYRYIYGDNFKTSGKDNREIERDIVLNYNVQHPKFKGLGFQFLHINYDVKVGKDYDEIRFLTRYQVKF